MVAVYRSRRAARGAVAPPRPPLGGGVITWSLPSGRPEAGPGGSIRATVATRTLFPRRRQFPQLGADRTERAVLVLLGREAVDIRAVRCVDRFLHLDRKVLLEIGLGRPLEAVDVTRNVVRIRIGQHRAVGGRSARHVLAR